MILFLTASSPGKAQGPGIRVIFDDAPPFEADAARLQENSNGVFRSRPVVVNLDRLGLRDGSGVQDGVAFQLNMFSDAMFIAVPEKVASAAPGKLLWRGVVLGVKESTVTIAVDGEAAVGTIQVDGKLYKLASTLDGSQVINEVNPGVPLREMQPIPVDAPSLESGRGLD